MELAPEEYEKVAARALRADPRNDAAWNNWGAGLFRDALYLSPESAVPLLKEAADKYSVAVGLRPDNATYWNNWGNALYQLASRQQNDADTVASLEAAAQKYERVVRLQPNQHAVWFLWGTILTDLAKRAPDLDTALSRFHEAQVRFAVATELAPAKVDYWEAWGGALDAEGSRIGIDTAPLPLSAEGCEKYAEAVRRDNKRHVSWHNWAALLLRMADRSEDAATADALFADADRKLTIALEIAPDVALYWYNLARVSLAHGRKRKGTERRRLLTEASARFGEGVARSPNDAAARAQWGSIYQERARALPYGAEELAARLYAEAAKKYEQAAALEPDSAAYQNDWGVALHRQADAVESAETDSLYRQAYAKFLRAVTLQPEADLSWSNLSAILGDLSHRATEPEEKLRLLLDAEAKAARATNLGPLEPNGWANWGNALLQRARITSDFHEAATIRREAVAKLKEGERLKPGTAAFNLACAAALEGDSEGARYWLEIAEKHEAISRPATLTKETALDPVREEDWFIALLERITQSARER